ncbi:LOW QUALITY PROTEIN: hypothetical protein CRUP_037644 [Coryphaenoides rupestris]|nr:LOW QUALITY PROTEIN: hypothetical protein CRUP_037644 [Coryphaenoides rupestris]
MATGRWRHKMAVHGGKLYVLGQQQPLQYGLRGLQTTLAPLIAAGPHEKILWTHGARKVVEFDGSEENVYGTFLGRLVLDWHTAELTIKDLQGSDSGAYELEATINSKTYYSEHEVAVIDKVAVPTITCLINGTDDGGNGSDPRSLAELRCSAEGPPSLITYDWTLRLHGGAALAVALRGEQDDTVYKCRAANPVSEETGTFVAKDCYPDHFPYTGLIIGVIAICLLLPLSHLAHTGQDTRPLDSTSEQEEEDTTKSGRLCNSSRVSVHSVNLPSESEPQHHPADLETKCSGEDSVCEFEEESKSNLPQAASPGGCGLHPVVGTERSATQIPERTSNDGRAAQAPTEPEEQQGSGTPGTPRPSDQSASEEDGEAECLASTCLEDPQSSMLKTTDGTTATTNPGPSPSPLPPPETSASDTRSNTPDITAPLLPPPPQPQIPPEDHLGSDNKGCKEEAGSSEPTMPEPAAVAVALKEEKDAPGPLVPLNIVGSPKEEEEERSDTWVESCVSNGDEPSSDECVVAIAAATNPQVNVEAPLPKVEEEEVNDRKLPHGDATEVPEEGEEGDGKDRVVAASLSEPASEPVETFRDSEESDTDTSTKNKEDTRAGTPEDNHYHHDNVTDVTRQGVVLRAEPEKKEEETVHDDTEVQEEGEEDEGGREGGTTGLTGMEMEPPGPKTQRQDLEPGESLSTIKYWFQNNQI